MPFHMPIQAFIESLLSWLMLGCSLSREFSILTVFFTPPIQVILDFILLGMNVLGFAMHYMNQTQNRCTSESYSLAFPSSCPALAHLTVFFTPHNLLLRFFLSFHRHHNIGHVCPFDLPCKIEAIQYSPTRRRSQRRSRLNTPRTRTSSSSSSG